MIVPFAFKSIGLRKLWLICAYALVPVYTGLIFSKNINLSIFFMTLNGLVAGSCSFSFVYAQAFVEKKHLTAVASCFMALDGLTTLTQSIFFRFISSDYQ